MADSIYYDPMSIRELVEAGQHRAAVGGLWTELGELQRDFLIGRGLKPEHTLLDIGCGALRAGVLFVDYLQPGHYFGIDISEDLIEAGYENELTAEQRQKLPRQNLLRTGSWEFKHLHQQFDYALAQAVFQHLTFNNIRACLERLRPSMRTGGEFYASFFLLPDDRPFTGAFTQGSDPEAIVTEGITDPYHYRLDDMFYAAKGLGWEAVYLGDWQHPRNLEMLFYRAV